MTVPAERTLVTLAVALVVWAAWSPSSGADVVELMTGEKVEGTVKGATPRGLVIEVRGRERTIARRLVRGIVFGPARPATPPPGGTQPSAAVAARAAAVPAPPKETSRAAPRGEAAQPGDYKIGPEDLLDIAVWNNTAMSRAVPVRPDGKISLPLVNDVQAAGLTPMQLREVLVGKLTAYIPRPEVSVIVREVHSSKASVSGE